MSRTGTSHPGDSGWLFDARLLAEQVLDDGYPFPAEHRWWKEQAQNLGRYVLRFEASTRHGIQYVERERNWPHQWLGRCRCGCAIRTNSESDVYRFFKEQGCVT